MIRLTFITAENPKQSWDGRFLNIRGTVSIWRINLMYRQIRIMKRSFRNS